MSQTLKSVAITIRSSAGDLVATTCITSPYTLAHSARRRTSPGTMHLPGRLTNASASYLLSLVVTAPIFARALTGKPVPPLVWLLVAVTTTVAFAAAHVTNFKTLPNHPAVLLLTLPQLISGGIYCYAAWRYGLRASILAYMPSNALRQVPLFVVGAVP